MAGCRSALKLIPLWAGGDLDEGGATRVRRHLEACPGCSAQAAQYLRMKDVARQLCRDDDEGLPDAVRGRLARQAAVAVRSRRSLRDWLGFPLEVAPRPAMALATLAAAFVLLVSLSLVRDRGESPVSAASDSIQLDVAYDGESVRLAWKDGRRESYRVYRSDDPRALTGGPPRIVEGRAWVDASPDTAPIIYYSIE